VFDEVAHLASTALDDLHATALGSPYWKVMVGHVLSALIPVVADLSLRLEHASTTGGVSVFRGHLPSRVPVTNRDARSHLYTDATFIGQVASGLAHVAGGSATVETEAAPPVDLASRRSRRSFRTGLDGALRSSTNRVANVLFLQRNRGAWVHDVTGAQRWIASRRLGEWLLPAPHVPTTWPATHWMPWDAAARDRLAVAFDAAAAASEHRLTWLTLSVAHLALPWRFVEGWSFRRDYADLRGLARRRVIVSSYPAEQRLSCLATAKASGAKLLFCQHGGSYGEGPMDWQERFERRVGDGFVSWGWGDGADVLVAPSPRLANFAQAYRRANSRRGPSDLSGPVKYFLHWSTDPPHGYGLGSFVRPEHFPSTHDVLAPMARSCPDVVVRKHPRTPRLDLTWADETASVRVEGNDVPSPVSVATSALVVFDIFRSTGFLECLAVRHPTVIFLATAPAARDAAHAELIRALQEARVLNVGHEAMDDFWRLCFPDLAGWWHDERVVAATDGYRRQHALVEQDWVVPLMDAVRTWLGPPSRTLRRGPQPSQSFP
jgi:hypothetical protein